MSSVFRDDDLSDGWLESGDPTYGDGSCDPGVAFEGDTNNNVIYMETGIIPIGLTEYTVAIGLFKPSDTGGTNFIIQQAVVSPIENAFRFFLSTNSQFFTAAAHSGVSDTLLSTSSTGFGANSVWKRILITVKVGVIAIYLNGVEVSYSVQNSVSGAGFSSVLVGGRTALGAQVNLSASFSNTKEERIEVHDTFFSAAEALDDFNDWVACVPAPEPLPISLPDETSGLLNEWDESDPALDFANTLTDPFELGTVLADAATSGQILTSKQIKDLNDWRFHDPSLADITPLTPFMLGDILNEAMGSPPFSTVLSADLINKLNLWSNSDPALFKANTLTSPFKMGDYLNELLTRS